MNKIYTGIGSRETPEDILEFFFYLAHDLALEGYTLRSGGAPGADQIFEKGCDAVAGSKEIYLPWSGFESNDSTLIVSDPKAFQIAEQFHPAWHRLSPGAKKLQARNSHQVLGKSLDSPTDFVVCWTPRGSGSGGTGQAIRIANHYNINVFDAGAYSLQEFRSILLDYISK